MKNRYVSFITDEHLLWCIDNLYNSYTRAKNNITVKNFYANKIDTVKLTFDAFFNELDDEELIQMEILRQIDKSINNSIGTFHEQILGGVQGFQVGNLSGYDIKASDDTLFADVKNKHNTMNSSAAEALFQKLARYADDYKKSKCYWVQILAKGSFEELWRGDINGKEYSHSRVFKISGDKFYALVTGCEDALCQLMKMLPIAIADYLQNQTGSSKVIKNHILEEIKYRAHSNGRNILEQITHENYNYYLGFDK